jgi:hypothetical protein
LLESRRHAEQALLAVVQQACIEGVDLDLSASETVGFIHEGRRNQKL